LDRSFLFDKPQPENSDTVAKIKFRRRKTKRENPFISAFADALKQLFLPLLQSKKNYFFAASHD
jgi:hypothetical protein